MTNEQLFRRLLAFTIKNAAETMPDYALQSDAVGAIAELEGRFRNRAFALVKLLPSLELVLGPMSAWQEREFDAGLVVYGALRPFLRKEVGTLDGPVGARLKEMARLVASEAQRDRRIHCIRAIHTMRPFCEEREAVAALARMLADIAPELQGLLTDIEWLQEKLRTYRATLVLAHAIAAEHDALGLAKRNDEEDEDFVERLEKYLARDLSAHRKEHPDDTEGLPPARSVSNRKIRESSAKNKARKRR